MKNYLKRMTTFILAILMLVSVPLQTFAEVTYNYNNLASNKNDIINQGDKLPVTPAKPEENEKAEEYIKNPDQPEIYTLRTDYRTEKGEKFEVSYQPYIASVGAAATQEEKDKVDKKINMPDITGYKKPQENYSINYDTIVKKAKEGIEKGNDTLGKRYKASQSFDYKAAEGEIKVKHVFQNLRDFNKYENPNGGKEELITTQKGNTGSTLEVKPLDARDIMGFVPESAYIKTQVPENTEDFVIEYRYNRNSFDVSYDTDGGSFLANRTLYYEQVMPPIEKLNMPKKKGSSLIGWKPSVELVGEVGGKQKKFKAGEIIKDDKGDPILDLNAKLIMPAGKVKFTAVWEENKKTSYTVLFWTEKSDHPKDASKEEKYDYIGTHTYNDVDTNMRPDLDNEPVKGVQFPDLDDVRLGKIHSGDKLYLNKFYVYNKDLTHNENADEKDQSKIKPALSTGDTVYNIYYDRQVYDLYFTKSNKSGSAFYPEIWKNDKKVGEEGNPYHFKARFNQSMVGLWPDDVKEVRGFTEGNNSLGWLPNLKKPKHFYRDTPPYRLSANLFIDFPELKDQDGYASEIDLGKGQTKPASITDLSFGIDQNDQTMPHHIDFWLDDLDGNEAIDYDLYTIKSDTASKEYKDFLPPDLQGFTPKNPGGRGSEFKEDSDLDDLNEEREEITPFPEVYYKELDENDEPKQKGKLYFMKYFPNDEDREFDQNGYLKFEYSRNKYDLKLNSDPRKAKADDAYTANEIQKVPYQKPLKDLNLDTNNKPEKPKDYKDDIEFKGWSLDPAGQKLVRENKETMPARNLVLYAKWGEPDSKWKVTIDPNGGELDQIGVDNLTKEKRTLIEGDVGNEKKVIYPIKEANSDGKQVFTVIQKQQLIKPKDPKRKGYNFLGWELVRYTKDKNGNYTDQKDESYKKEYGVPELYSFGNYVVSPIYLRAIWVPNDKVDIDIFHYFLDKDGKIIDKKKEILSDKRTGFYTSTVGDKQGEEWTLAPHNELLNSKDETVQEIYKPYNDRVKANNTYFHILRVEPEKIQKDGNLVENPNFKNNVFNFFYRRFRTRDYKVNYIDERFKGTENEKDGAIVPQEFVSDGNRHFDARNYRPIPGWKLVSAPQQQLVFDLDEDTNKLKGINGTGKDEITFYYKDVRVIEVKKDDSTPDGYVRVTFKADKGGSFGKDAEGKDITELNYDVIKGLKSDLLPVPKELAEGETADKEKHYITPETGKKFVKWDEKPLLNKNTILDNVAKDFYVFTAKFEWSGLTASGLVRTEAFNDPNNKWTNNFAPTIEQLKAQLVWMEKGKVEKLPEGAVIQLYDEAGNKLTTDDQVYNLVNEKGKADKDELVRTVNVKAKVTFTDGKDPQELDIPITVYKNVYEALNVNGDKPLFLKEAEGKEAKDGGLKDILKNNEGNRYIRVTIKPNKDFDSKDDKVYYVNPNAWVEIPKIDTKGDSNFTNWTADKKEQNDESKENGNFDFAKRHKFTKDTIITPVGADDVVEQKEGEDKPKVPDNFVKVIVKTTDKAKTELTQTFWVNPTKEVTIQITEPTGKENQKVTIDDLGEKDVNYIFKEWQKVKTGEADDKLTDVTPAVKVDLAKNKFTDKVTVIEAAYKKSIQAEPIVEPLKTKKLDTPQGKEITDEILKGLITPQEGKEIDSIEVISKPDPSNPGKTEAKVIVKYKDGTTQGTNDNPVVIPVEVHKNIIPEAPGGQKPKDALENYVKVIFKAGEGGKLDKTLTGNFVYYVSPEVEVDLNETANDIGKIPATGYITNGGKWTNKDNKELKGTFKDQETVFKYNFFKSEDIVEKTDQNPNKPDGYVTVTFKTEDEAKGKLAKNKLVKIYYVNPKAGIKLVELAEGTQAAEKQLAVPKTVPAANYEFDKWYESIDKENPITNNREYVARFVKGGVNLTYDANGATGTVPSKVIVAQGTSVRLASAAGLSKKDYTFAGWKFDGDDKLYQAGDEVTLDKNKKAVAQLICTLFTGQTSKEGIFYEI